MTSRERNLLSCERYGAVAQHLLICALRSYHGFIPEVVGIILGDASCSAEGLDNCSPVTAHPHFRILFHLCARTGSLSGMYQWLDRAPKGRNETGLWWRRNDEYDKR